MHLLRILSIIPIMIWSCELIPEVLGFENQESAEEAYRGRIMSAFSVGMLGSAPIGAILLGWFVVQSLQYCTGVPYR